MRLVINLKIYIQKNETLKFYKLKPTIFVPKIVSGRE